MAGKHAEKRPTLKTRLETATAALVCVTAIAGGVTGIIDYIGGDKPATPAIIVINQTPALPEAGNTGADPDSGHEKVGR